ncbi:MAG: DUF488 family protein, N3 subclade [Candidatus Aminicenantales bacterium]
MNPKKLFWSPRPKWYGHDPKKKDEFKKRYYRETEPLREPIDLLLKKSKEVTILLLFSSKEEKLNNAVALKEYLEKGRNP